MKHQPHSSRGSGLLQIHDIKHIRGNEMPEQVRSACKQVLSQPRNRIYPSSQSTITKFFLPVDRAPSATCPRLQDKGDFHSAITRTEKDHNHPQLSQSPSLHLAESVTLKCSFLAKEKSNIAGTFNLIVQGIKNPIASG